MRDLTLILILAGLVGAALFRPWLGVLGLTVLSYLHPHSWGGAMTQSFPMYKILFAATLLSTLYAAWRRREGLQWPPLDWRLAMLAGLWLYFAFTTYHARVPWEAWPSFVEFTKILLSLLLTLVLVDTRNKLFALFAVTALCLALVAVKGGFWALVSGFSDRVHGPPNTEYADNNHFALATIMNIPLLWLWLRSADGAPLRSVLATALVLSVLAVLSSWSRGGLLALVATLSLLTLLSPKKLLVVPLLLALVGAAIVQMPHAWHDRMQTIAAEQADVSAQHRLDAWRIGVERAIENPFSGGGFRSWRLFTLNRGELDWHSAYIQIVTDHGMVAFALWVLLLVGSIAVPLRNAMRPARAAPDAWLTAAGLYVAASLLGYAVGAAFLSAAYWDLPYHLMALGILVAQQERAARPGGTGAGATSSGAGTGSARPIR